MPSAAPRASFHFLQQGMGIALEQSAKFQELDDVQAPLAMFDLGDEGLRATELVRQGLLGQTCALPSLAQFGQ